MTGKRALTVYLSSSITFGRSGTISRPASRMPLEAPVETRDFEMRRSPSSLTFVAIGGGVLVRDNGSGLGRPNRRAGGMHGTHPSGTLLAALNPNLFDCVRFSTFRASLPVLTWQRPLREQPRRFESPMSALARKLTFSLTDQPTLLRVPE
jgi:hypothetical protein